MRTLPFVFAVAGSFCATVQAFDATTDATVRTVYVTSKISSSPFDNKLILEARDDAASFVASGGALRGARLEAALHRLREKWSKQDSDMELAEAILFSSLPIDAKE
ncbi:DUF2388 domain-containing protein [Azomonas macrocytogenes]|uniref:Uncharacterized protein (TIGR02448 family) n=1 Tax=Azomonas macrocytogenes TaxID=69962 RepID=A0A839T2B5_AZOMA|nr:DUF2388 domain-containing protein [Azomonas macrocytogenes]MBB3103248.1 uncharacterized protein (TIGR02448 family) [Azomonas macrocytogenes]